jgi:hypothetical protein
MRESTSDRKGRDKGCLILAHRTMQAVLEARCYNLTQGKAFDRVVRQGLSHMWNGGMKFGEVANYLVHRTVKMDVYIYIYIYIYFTVQWNSSISGTVRNRTRVHIQFLCLEWPILWPPRIFIIPRGILSLSLSLSLSLYIYICILIQKYRT